MNRICPLLCLLVACGPSEDPSPTAPRNLLVISIDTLRADHLDRMPFVSKLRSEGLVASQFRQCSNWTWNSMTCTVAGRTPVEIGHVTSLFDNDGPVPEGTPMLASWLADAGFSTAVVTTNDFFSERWGTTQGFQSETLVPFDTATEVAAQGMDLVPAKGQWYLHLHFIEPHQPYNPDEAFSGAVDALEPWEENLRNNATLNKWRALHDTLPADEQALLEAHFTGLYDAEVQWLDAQLQGVFDELDRRGLLDRTLVAVVTDHGEQFWESGFQGHGYQLLGEENDAAFFLWGAEVEPGVWAQPTTAVDLVPTVLERLDVPVPDVVTGVALGSREPGPIFADSHARIGGVQSVTLDGWKLQYGWTDTWRLHDRNTDPDEAVDLYSVDHPKVAELWSLLEPRVAMMRAMLEGE